MGATTSQRLIINVDNGSLVPTYEGRTGVTQPKFVLGDTVPVEVYLVKSTGGGASTVTATSFPPGALVRLAVGVVNQSPTDGTWRLSFGGEDTTELDFDITDAELETALNALASITAAGGVTVGRVGNQYQITFVQTGNKGFFTGNSISLFPASAIQIQTLKEGSATENETVLVNLAVTPIALTNQFTDLPQPGVSHTENTFTLTGSIKGGSYRLRLSWLQAGTTYTTWTQPIVPDQSPSGISQIIFQALVNAGWGVIDGNATTNAWGCSVTGVDQYSWRVDFVAPKFTTPVSVVAPTVIEIDGDNLTYLPGKAAELNLATAEAIAYLGNASSKSSILEVEIESDTVVQTVIQTNCTLLGEVIVNGAFQNIALDVPISEAVANARFVRRDTDQPSDPATINQIWENITGQTTVAGTELSDALHAADAPSATNHFVTVSDVEEIASNLDVVSITFADSTIQTTAYPGFDQLLNTYNNVQFKKLDIFNAASGGLPLLNIEDNFKVDSQGKVFANVMFETPGGYEGQYLGLITNEPGATFPNQLNIRQNAAYGGVYNGAEFFAYCDGIWSSNFDFPARDTQPHYNWSSAFLKSFDTLGVTNGQLRIRPVEGMEILSGGYETSYTRSSFSIKNNPSGFEIKADVDAASITIGNAALTDSSLLFADGVTGLSATTGLTFPSSNILADAIPSPGTTIHSGGGGHLDVYDYPDEVQLVINGVYYAIPARVI